MKGIIVASAFLCALGVSVSAGTFDKFNTNVSQGAQSVIEGRLNALAYDLGAAISQTSFHQAGTIAGKLPGVDIGVHTGYKTVSSKNDILKSAGVDALMLPLAQLEVGIPFINLDLIGRYTTYDQSSLVGFGARYSVFKTLPFDISALVLYNTLNVSAAANKFSSTVTTVSLGMNFNVPMISPYMAASYDSAKVVPDAAITSLEGKSAMTRLDAGVNLSLMPFTYFNLGAAYVMGDESSAAYRAGLGIKF